MPTEGGAFQAMTENFGRLLTAVAKRAPAPMLGVAIACTLVIFLPGDAAGKLGIEDFRTEYKGFLGWGFIFGWSYLLAALIWRGKEYVSDKIAEHRMQRARERSLHELTAEEKGYLAEFLAGRNTIYCEPSDGVAGGLVAKGVMYGPTHVYEILEGVPLNIQPWARRYLEEHPELLNGARKRGSRAAS
jgi:hypothetical protein